MGGAVTATHVRARAILLVLSLALAACAGVLGIRPKETSRHFEHRAHVLKGVACVQCHAGITAAGDDDPLHLPPSTTCLRCHEKPHDARECAGCHGVAHTRARAELARKHLRFAHKTHQGPSSGQCVRCHGQIGTGDVDAMRPLMGACLSCHAHEDQFAMRACDACHRDLPAERIRPESHVVHEGDFVREHGVRAASARDLCATCHADRFCSGCHGATVPALPARLAFDDPKLSGLHRAGFRSRHAMEARAEPGLCMTCHFEDSCRACHEREHVAARSGARGSPHPRGWLAATRGGGEHGTAARVDPASCAGCHGGAGEQLCVSCHRVGGAGGNPHGPGFSSTKDKLRDVPCRACHAP
jgi:hypothetical protein